MYHKTRGIVLHHIKYSDNSIIAYIYTELFGRQTYMVKGIHGKKAKININLFSPLSILDMNVSNKPKREIQMIDEARIIQPLLHIPYDIAKSSISVFLAEILYKSLKEEMPNADMFHFIAEHINLLDIETLGVQNFHIYFLMKLSKYLGFYPENNFTDNTKFFDISEGYFVSKMPIHSYFIDKETTRNFALLIETDYKNIHQLPFTKTTREEVLSKLIQYYQVHLISMNEIKSLEVLKEVFS